VCKCVRGSECIMCMRMWICVHLVRVRVCVSVCGGQTWFAANAWVVGERVCEHGAQLDAL
jgi:hypothetical protein